jgi:uncharacterized membrane protein HdeD (DUF308 family)/alpha-beta hydrolase superfamily lysophospholipase
VRRSLRWLRVALGLLCTTVGAVLTVGPFASLAVLVALAVAGLILTGMAELGRAGRVGRAGRTPEVLTGLGWLVVGIGVVVWPGLTIRVLALVIGVSLIVAGAVAAVLAIRAGEGVRALLLGTISVILGIVALSWPGPTVFVVAAVFGIRLLLFGVADVVAGERHWPRAVAPVVAVVLLGFGVWLHPLEPRPDAFYTPPAGAPGAAGALLRSEPFSRGAPAGAHAWRILYATTRDDHTPAVASALVLASAQVPPGPRPVVAWAHGATGIARGCAPSLLDNPLGSGAMPGLDQVLARGWVVVATDYTGLGTAGPHPFLIGQGEARSILDAVRATRQLGAVAVGDRTAVWGHSQGGNAALWTGILAPTYAPDVQLIGVAALAPGTQLVDFARLWGEGQAIFGAYLIQAYSDTYPDVRFGSYVRPSAGLQVRELAQRCLSESKIYLSGISTLLFGQSIWATDPGTGAFGARLRQNIPTGPIPVPVLVAQGEDDAVVTPGSQADYVRARCAAGGRVDYRTYPGRDHVGLIAVDAPLIPDLVRWTQDRLDGAPAPSTCPS